MSYTRLQCADCGAFSDEGVLIKGIFYCDECAEEED